MEKKAFEPTYNGGEPIEYNGKVIGETYPIRRNWGYHYYPEERDTENRWNPNVSRGDPFTTKKDAANHCMTHHETRIEELKFKIAQLTKDLEKYS